MAKIFKSVLRSRWLKIVGCFVVAIALVVVVFYQVVNRRGAVAKELAMQRLKDAGEDFSVGDLLSDPVPDEENFYATPSLVDLARRGSVGDAARKKMAAVDPKQNLKGTEDKAPSRQNRGPTTGVSHDLEAWLRYLGEFGGMEFVGIETDPVAERVLRSLDAAHGDLFREFASAAERPHSQVIFNNVDRIEDQHFWQDDTPTGSIMAVLRLYQIRGVAAAQCGDRELFLECVRVLSRFSEGLEADPALISSLVWNATVSITYGLVWEGINSDVLNERDLSLIENQVVDIDPRPVLLQALRGELISLVRPSEYLREAAVEGLSSGDWSSRMVMQWMPRGWFDANCAVLVNWMLDHFIVPWRDEPLDRAHEIATEFGERMQSYKVEPWADGGQRVLALIAMPAIQLVLDQAVKIEAQRRQLLAACALERFRIQSGRYPDSLAELAPGGVAILQPDPFLWDGVEMGYRLEGTRYCLWSVGKDRIDDGGENDSDVVWQFDGELPSSLPKSRRSFND